MALGEVRKANKLIIRKLKGRVHLEDLDIDEWKICNRILKIRGMSMWAE
jgi:hypothetical protein